jgi:hypothetical protein
MRDHSRRARAQQEGRALPRPARMEPVYGAKAARLPPQWTADLTCYYSTAFAARRLG